MIEAQGPYDEETGTSSWTIPIPPQRFVSNGPNRHLHFGIGIPYSWSSKDANQPGLELLRFPPMKIKVEKPVTAPFFAYSDTNQGVYISLIGTRSNSLVWGFDDGLQWRAFCENQHSVLESPDLSSGVQNEIARPGWQGGSAQPRLAGRSGSDFDAMQTSDKMPPGTQGGSIGFLVWHL